MVAKIIIGKHIGGILGYNEHKVQKGSAKFLWAENFPSDAQDLSLKQKLRQFDAYTELNRRTKTNAVHISLNFDNADKLNNELLKEISQQYMEAIGFADQPYLLYRHFDAAHPHVHIVTTNIQSTGERIDLHNIGKHKSEPARKQLENHYGLVIAEGKKNQEDQTIKPVNVKKAVYGSDETKQAVSNIVGAVVRNWKFTSLPELNAILNQYNVMADRGKEDSMMFRKNGLVYRMLDSKGQKIGVPIKASSIYGKPTLKFLEKRYKLNEELRRPVKQQLRQVLDSAIQLARSQTDFQKHLSRNGVEVIFRKNNEGRVYGVTFLDHDSRTVFNGSALGKGYSANALMEAFSKVKDLQSTSKGSLQSGLVVPDGHQIAPKVPDPIYNSEIISTLLKPDYPEALNIHFGPRRKRRKKRNHLS